MATENPSPEESFVFDIETAVTEMITRCERVEDAPPKDTVRRHEAAVSVRVLVGDCREMLRTLPDESVHCVVTSPPYWGLRDYGVDGQLGLEATPGEYVAALVAVFREVRRVLRDDGTLWLNLGDSYAGGNTGGKWREGSARADGKVRGDGATSRRNRNGIGAVEGMKPKDLIGIPWRVAFALQADGWWLRSDIIWAKSNTMPESVQDRPTKAHEYVFLLTKAARYFYDAEAINAQPLGPRRNARTVWTIATEPFPEAHYATFPTELAKRCILAGTSERGACVECGAPWKRIRERLRDGEPLTGTGWRPTCEHTDAATRPCVVLDPFGGSGTTGLVADRLQRDAILIELNPEYAAMARRRIERDAGMFAEVALA